MINQLETLERLAILPWKINLNVIYININNIIKMQTSQSLDNDVYIGFK